MLWTTKYVAFYNCLTTSIIKYIMHKIWSSECFRTISFLLKICKGINVSVAYMWISLYNIQSCTYVLLSYCVYRSWNIVTCCKYFDSSILNSMYVFSYMYAILCTWLCILMYRVKLLSCWLTSGITLWTCWH